MAKYGKASNIEIRYEGGTEGGTLTIFGTVGGQRVVIAYGELTFGNVAPAVAAVGQDKRAESLTFDERFAPIAE